MDGLVKGKATICLVNYKTFEFTRLCLRSIRKFTNYPYEVIVVDNDSQDESLEYLRSLKWIELIERKAEPNEPGGGYSHAVALDVGLEKCRTEFFISLHSDVFVQRSNWIADLMKYFDGDENLACVGTGKIELMPLWRIWLKNKFDLKALQRKILRTPDPSFKFKYFNRTIYSIYRTEVLKKHNLTFFMGRDKGMTAGKKLYFELLEKEYKTVELPQRIVGKYVLHLAHATQAVNPNEFSLKKHTLAKYRNQFEKIMSSGLLQSIAADETMDS